MRLGFILCLCLAAGAARSDLPTDPGWGLPAATIVDRPGPLAGAELTPVAPPRLYGSGLQAPFMAHDVAVFGALWRVWLQAGPEGALRQLLFQPQSRGLNAAMVLDGLRALYGAEQRLCVTAVGGVEAVWDLPAGRLHVTALAAAQPADRRVMRPAPSRRPTSQPPDIRRPRAGLTTVPVAPDPLPLRDRPGPRRLFEPGERPVPLPRPQIAFPPPSRIRPAQPETAVPDRRQHLHQPSLRRPPAVVLRRPVRLSLRLRDPGRTELASRTCPLD
ncbi:MAG: hypothetical protein AAGD12_07530 [Pseudomonadota bacterium]